MYTVQDKYPISINGGNTEPYIQHNTISTSRMTSKEELKKYYTNQTLLYAVFGEGGRGRKRGGRVSACFVYISV